MPIPASDRDQRSAAVSAGVAARVARADAKRRLRTREWDLDALLRAADRDAVLGGLRVREVLLALPGYGPVRVAALMSEVSIAPSRRLRGLGRRQRAALLERMT